MKQRILTCLIALTCLLAGCGTNAGSSAASQSQEEVSIVATTYPIYLLIRSVTEGVEGVSVERLNTGETSCLHDYTLSVDDMKKVEGADILVLNGAGLEEETE